MKRRSNSARAPSRQKAQPESAYEIAIRSDIAIPPCVLPWERALLLQHVRALLESVLQGAATDADDEKG